MNFGRKILVVSVVIAIATLLLNCYFGPKIMGFGVNALVVSVVIAITAVLLNCYFAPEIVIPKNTDGWFGKEKLKSIKK